MADIGRYDDVAHMLHGRNAALAERGYQCSLVVQRQTYRCQPGPSYQIRRSTAKCRRYAVESITSISPRGVLSAMPFEFDFTSLTPQNARKKAE